MYTISQISEILGISEYTIRYYDGLGLIHGIERDHRNNRLFSQEAVEGLLAVITLRDLGFSIAETREYQKLLEDHKNTIRDRYMMLSTKRDSLRKHLDEARSRLAYLEDRLEYLGRSMNGERIPSGTDYIREQTRDILKEREPDEQQ